MGHENGGWMNEDQRAGDWPDVYVECDVCGNPRLRGGACGHCRKKFDEAMARLDAEVAEHEGDDELVCPACGRPYALNEIGCPTLSEAPTMTVVNATGRQVEFRVTALPPDPDDITNGVAAGTGASLRGPIVEPAAPTDEARFGERLMRFIHANQHLDGRILSTLGRIAEAIVLDAEEQHAANCAGISGLLRGQRLTLRQKIEEAVEHGRYSVEAYPHARYDLARKDVLDAKPFLEEVGRIFGEWPAPSLLDGTEAILAEFLPWALATFPDSTPKSCAAHLRKEAEELLANPLDRGEVADVLFLAVDLCQRAGVKPAEAMREKLAELRTRTWGEPDAHGVVEHVREHEPAHERRERASARHEDSAGRVEGVDR